MISEKPVIARNDQTKSNLSERLYSLLENELAKPTKNLSSLNNLGRLAINLLLNEGITDQHLLTTLLNSKKSWFRYDDAFYFHIDDKRQFVGQETVLLLSHHWIHFNSKAYTNKQILNAINIFLSFKGTITPENKVSYRDLKIAFKIEQAYSINPNALLMIGSNKIPKQVSHETFMRLLTNKKGNVDKIDYKKSPGNKQWTTIWGTKIARQQFNINEDPIKLGFQTIFDFLAELTGKPVAQSKGKKTINKDIKRWLDDEKNINYQPATWLMVAWIHKLKKDGNVQGNMGVGSIKDYVKSVSKVFIPIFAELNLNNLSLDEWGDNFNLMIRRFNSTKRQVYARYFISFLVDSGFLPKYILERIEIDGNPISISANLISLDHAEIILDHLAKSKSTTSIVARLVFCFGMFGSNRRGEVQHLQLRNITLGDNYANEKLYSRKGEKLKTPNANRNVALDIFWPEAELALLSSYIDERTLATNNSKAELFEPNELRKAFDLITELLIEITGDHNVGYHILRHSFCNWLLMLISLPIEGAHSSVQTLLSSNYMTQERAVRLKERLGISITASRKELFALSEMLGHGDVFTSLKHYFHLSEYYWDLQKNSYCKNIPTFAKQLFGYNTEVITTYPFTIKNNVPLQQVLNNFPPFKCELSDIPHENLKAIISKYTCKQVNDNKSTLSQVFKIFLLENDGYENIRISQDLGLSIDVVNRVLDQAQCTSESSLVRSKYNLEKNPLSQLPTHKLTFISGQSESFDKLSESVLASLDLDKALDPIDTISISKNHLLRTQSHKMILELVRLLKSLRFNVYTRVNIKVYMVPKGIKCSEDLGIYIKRYQFVLDEFTRVC